MHVTDLIGAWGVAILLIAFALNLMGALPRESPLYSALNLIGASIAGIASYMIGFWPFVVLESVWAMVSLAGLIKALRA